MFSIWSMLSRAFFQRSGAVLWKPVDNWINGLQIGECLIWARNKWLPWEGSMEINLDFISKALMSDKAYIQSVVFRLAWLSKIDIHLGSRKPFWRKKFYLACKPNWLLAPSIHCYLNNNRQISKQRNII